MMRRSKKEQRKIEKKANSMLAFMLSLCMLLGGFAASKPAFAADGDEISTDVTLGQSGSAEVKSINVGANAVKINSTGWDRWDGSGQYIYYGSYNGDPVKYRVLDRHNGTSNTKFNDGSETMSTAEGDYLLLDGDAVLFAAPFYDHKDENGEYIYNNNYADSDIRAYLKDGKDASGNSLFSSKELSAVADTKLAASSETYRFVDVYRDNEAKVNKTFLLSVAEVAQTYQYQNELGKYERDTCESAYWWLRSAINDLVDPVVIDDDNKDTAFAGHVCYEGVVGGVHRTGHVSDGVIGVAPAFNLNLESVIFTSASEASKSDDLQKIERSEDKEFKVTLKDESKTVKTTDNVTRTGKTISVPYSCTGDDVDQVSIVFTSGDIKDPDTTVLYYGKLADPADSGTATFEMPQGLTSGYKAYILAEDLNEGMNTDYSSAPFEISIPPQEEDDPPQPAPISTGDSKATADLPIKTTINGSPSKDAIWTFNMEAKDKSQPHVEGAKDGIATGTIKGSGTFEFGEITFTEAGKYEYEIYEVNTKDASYKYDGAKYTLVYEVTLNDAGKLECKRTVYKDGKEVSDIDSFDFTNEYIKDDSGKGGNGGDNGNDNVGGSGGNNITDENESNTGTDDGAGTNVKDDKSSGSEAGHPVQTGDDSQLAVFAVILSASIAALMGIVIRQLRKRREML